MSKLTQDIPPQGFELIRDRIYAILKDEFENLYTRTSDPIYQADFFLERSATSFSRVEIPCINVMLSRGDFSEKAVVSESGTYSFNIDVYASAKIKDADEGLADTRVSKTVHAIVGKCRAILSSSMYSRLAFAAPFIARTTAKSIQCAEPNRLDALTTMQGRLVFEVKCTEVAENAIPKTLEGFDSLLKIEETNLGFDYTDSNI